MKALWIFMIAISVSHTVYAEWKIDFSRRRKQLLDEEKLHSVQYKKQRRGLASIGSETTVAEKNKTGFLDMAFERQGPQQELVIMHSENGFSPANLRVNKNQRYKVHVVNVSKKSKNVSFMLDAFSQHHGTFFGEPVSFVIEPRKEGLYQFQCPETAAMGQLVVSGLQNPVDSPLQKIELRQPASR